MTVAETWIVPGDFPGRLTVPKGIDSSRRSSDFPKDPFAFPADSMIAPEDADCSKTIPLLFGKICDFSGKPFSIFKIFLDCYCSYLDCPTDFSTGPLTAPKDFWTAQMIL
jgi:hypothetical protein